jgi:2-(3-amino-3-carboxypropyl)histidine synthase
MLVHYGHSCLVPMDATRIRTLYVFVEISVDSDHLAKTIRRNFPSERETFLRDVVRATDSSTNGGVDVPIGTVIGGQRRVKGEVQESRGEIELELDTQMAQLPTPSKHTRLALVSTIQFAAALNRLKEDLSTSTGEDTSSTQKPGDKTVDDPSAIIPYSPGQDLDAGTYEITVPRSKPLSPGEILGCTAPRLNDVDAIL